MTFEPPIQNLDSLDIVGVRKRGGLDLVVVVSGPLDGGADTLRRVSEKLRTYIDAAASGKLEGAYPDAHPGPIRIIVRCRHAIDTAVLGLIRSIGRDAKLKGTSVELDASHV